MFRGEVVGWSDEGAKGPRKLGGPRAAWPCKCKRTVLTVYAPGHDPRASGRSDQIHVVTHDDRFAVWLDVESVLPNLQCVCECGTEHGVPLQEIARKLLL
jgi:hypothetical protein